MQSILSFFKYLADTNTINFIIMAIILYVILKKVNINQTINKAVTETKNTLTQSEINKDNANKQQKKSKAELNKLPSEIEEIKKFTKQKSKTFKDQLNENCQKTIERINLNTNKIIAIEEKKISDEIQNETVQDSIDTAKNSIINMLKNNPQMHYQFIEESLEELEEIELS